MRALGFEPDRAEIAAMIAKIDADGRCVQNWRISAITVVSAV